LLEQGCTGMLAFIRGLTEPPSKWECSGMPLTSLMNIEERKGKKVPVIQKQLVDLDGKIFNSFKMQRSKWIVDDMYRNPGPIQYYGPLADEISHSLALEQSEE